ncbi:uncharacterized protein K452DRAFT_303393, partial [Aplosporella prunicola CBS 121167]
TQRSHDWASPKYRFTREQKRAWRVLVVEARKEAEGESGEESEEEEEEESS